MAAYTKFADRLEIFFGDANDAISHVYARLRGPEAETGHQLTGSLTGPSCLYAETLPATFSLVDRGPGKSLLAEAIVPEPCFWTPDMPQQYRAKVHLCHQGNVVASAERFFGIRTLGADGRKLIFDGKRWVLRGICKDELPAIELDKWHESGATMMVRNPDDALCQEASRVGVLIVAQLDAPHVHEIQRLSRWPAMAIVVLPSQPTIDLNGLAHNLLLAERFAPGRPILPAPWAQIAICDASHHQELECRLAKCPLPVIATRIGAEPLSTIAAGRTLCDRLQRDLAGRVEISGYMV